MLEGHISKWQVDCSDYALHLLSMTTCQPHPAAENPIIIYPRTIDLRAQPEVSLSITNSRLAILVGSGIDGVEVVVWDWKTGMIVLVSKSLPLVVVLDQTVVSTPA